MPSRTLLILLCLVAPPVEALVDYVVDNFLTDYSGSPADLVGIDPALGDSVKMLPRERKYVLRQPVFLTDSSTSENGQAGTTPIVQSVSPGVFQVGYVSWPAFHVTKHADDLVYPLAHIVSRKVTLEEGKITMERAVKLAGFENRPDQFGAGQSPNRSPTYFSYLAEGSRYMSFWGSMDPGAYIRWTNSVVPAGGGDGDSWGKYLFEAPNDPVNVPGYGELGAALIPGTGGKKAVIAYEHVIDPGFNHQNEVRWIDLDDYPTSTRVRFTRNPNYGEDFVVAADSSGQALVMWRENQSIWATVYSSAQVAVVPPALIKAGVHVQDGVVPHFFRPYAAVNLARGLYAIAYTVGGQLEYRYLAVSGGAPAVAGSATLTIGAATTVTRPLDFARYPSLAVSNYRLVILYYNRQTADTDSLKARVIGLDGSFGIRPSPDTTDPAPTPDVTDIVLSHDLVSFNAVGSGWYKCCHYYRAPSVAVDPDGHIAVAYDNQFLSKLSLYSNSPIFYDTATFTSRAVPISSLPTALPFDASLDSVEYEDYRAVVRNSSGGPPLSSLLLAVSADGSFTDPGSQFGAFPFGRRMPVGAFKYRILLQANPPDNTTYTRIDSLILRYNVKPRRPAIDSLRIGSAPMAAYDSLRSYAVLPRKDSIRLVLSGVDIDDGAPVRFHLFSGSRLVDSATSSKTSPGRYRAVISFKPPDSLPDPLQLSIRVRDDSGWSSLPVAFRPTFRNLAPAETVIVTRRRGADSGGVYRSRGRGGRDAVPGRGRPAGPAAGGHRPGPPAPGRRQRRQREVQAAAQRRRPGGSPGSGARSPGAALRGRYPAAPGGYPGGRGLRSGHHRDLPVPAAAQPAALAGFPGPGGLQDAGFHGPSRRVRSREVSARLGPGRAFRPPGGAPGSRLRRRHVPGGRGQGGVVGLRGQGGVRRGGSRVLRPGGAALRRLARPCLLPAAGVRRHPGHGFDRGLPRAAGEAGVPRDRARFHRGPGGIPGGPAEGARLRARLGLHRRHGEGRGGQHRQHPAPDPFGGHGPGRPQVAGSEARLGVPRHSPPEGQPAGYGPHRRQPGAGREPHHGGSGREAHGDIPRGQRLPARRLGDRGHPGAGDQRPVQPVHPAPDPHGLQRPARAPHQPPGRDPGARGRVQRRGPSEPAAGAFPPGVRLLRDGGASPIPPGASASTPTWIHWRILPVTETFQVPSAIGGRP